MRIGEILISPDFKLSDRSVILIEVMTPAETCRQVALFLKPEAPGSSAHPGKTRVMLCQHGCQLMFHTFH